MDNFLWWSGLIGWLTFGALGMLVVTDLIMDAVIKNIWSKGEFLAFVHDRLRRPKAR